MENHDIKKILVYRIGHLGDTLVTMSAFWAIRNQYPNAEMTLLTNVDSANPNFVTAKGVLPDEGLFDGILTYVSTKGRFGSIWEYVKLLPVLKKGKFDAIVYLTTRNRTLAQIDRELKFFRLAGIKKKSVLKRQSGNGSNTRKQDRFPKLIRNWIFSTVVPPKMISRMCQKTMSVCI